MFRFTIRELVLVTLVVAISFGWFVDHGMMAIRYAQLNEGSRLMAEDLFRFNREVRWQLDGSIGIYDYHPWQGEELLHGRRKAPFGEN